MLPTESLEDERIFWSGEIVKGLEMMGNKRKKNFGSSFYVLGETAQERPLRVVSQAARRLKAPDSVGSCG